MAQAFTVFVKGEAFDERSTRLRRLTWLFGEVMWPTMKVSREGKTKMRVFQNNSQMANLVWTIVESGCAS